MYIYCSFACRKPILPIKMKFLPEGVHDGDGSLCCQHEGHEEGHIWAVSWEHPEGTKATERDYDQKHTKLA